MIEQMMVSSISRFFMRQLELTPAEMRARAMLNAPRPLAPTVPPALARMPRLEVRLEVHPPPGVPPASAALPRA